MHDIYSTTLKVDAIGVQDARSRIFVPPGTLRLYVSAKHAIQSTSTAIAARFGAAPQGDQSAVDPDDEGLFDFTSTMPRLEDGQELTFSSKAGSSILTISDAIYDISLGAYKTTKGGWVYLRQLIGEPKIDLKVRADVQRDCYSTWFAAAKWDQDGNPLQNATHTCKGTIAIGDEPVAAEAPFTISQTTPDARPGQSVIATIAPSSVSMASCTLSTLGPTAQTSKTVAMSVAREPGAAVSVAQAVAPVLAAGVLASKLEIKCTSAGGNTVSTQTSVPVDTPEAVFTLTHTTSDFSAGARLRVAIDPADIGIKSCKATSFGASNVQAGGFLSLLKTGAAYTASGAVPALAQGAAIVRVLVSCTSHGGRTVELLETIATDPQTPATPPRAIGIKGRAANGGVSVKATVYPASDKVGQSMRLWTGIVATPFWGPPVLVMRTAQGWRPMDATEGLVPSNIFQTITPPPTGSTVTLLDGDMTEADLAAINAVLYLVHQTGTAGMELFGQPLLECSGRACLVPAQ